MPGRAGGLLRWLLIERALHPRPRDPDPSSLTIAAPAFATPGAAAGDLTLTWVGHATFLIQIGGRNILTDPMWGERASPLRFAGPCRWVRPGVALDALPPIDAVVQSHNHYDHFDDGTVRELARRHPRAHWFAPLGLGASLRRRGVMHVSELDWWEERRHEGITYTCTPAQHFSARGPWDRNRTLWCSWGIAAERRRVHFGGDSGLHPEYRRIGEVCGPFDAVLLPVGADEPRWFMRPVHMNPEEAVHACGEVSGAGTRGPGPTPAAVNGGAFSLTDEPMDEPPRRLRAAWAAAGQPSSRLWIPAHGETLTL
mgnify:CR=1 FL=1